MASGVNGVSLTIDNCAIQLLCGLSAATRNALVQLINGYIIALEAEESLIRVQLLKAQIALAPINLAAQIAEEALQKAKAAANIVPLNLIGQCVSIGNLNLAIQQNLDIILQDIVVITNDLNRLLSIQDAFQAEINQINSTIQYYQNIIATLNACPFV